MKLRYYNGRWIFTYNTREEAQETANILNATGGQFYYIPEFRNICWCIAVHDKWEHLEFWCFL